MNFTKEGAENAETIRFLQEILCGHCDLRG